MRRSSPGSKESCAKRSARGEAPGERTGSGSRRLPAADRRRRRPGPGASGRGGGPRLRLRHLPLGHDVAACGGESEAVALVELGRRDAVIAGLLFTVGGMRRSKGERAGPTSTTPVDSDGVLVTVSIDSRGFLASAGERIGVAPLVMTCFGPAPRFAGFAGRTWLTTSQSAGGRGHRWPWEAG